MNRPRRNRRMKKKYLHGNSIEWSTMENDIWLCLCETYHIGPIIENL